jgi:hypothetical protein
MLPKDGSVRPYLSSRGYRELDHPLLALGTAKCPSLLNLGYDFPRPNPWTIDSQGTPSEHQSERYAYIGEEARVPQIIYWGRKGDR